MVFRCISLKEFRRWNTCWCMVSVALLAAAAHVAAAHPQPKLTPRQLVALARAAEQRYWSVLYTVVEKDYQGITLGKPLPKRPDAISREDWWWTPWGSKRIVDRSILAVGSKGAFRQLFGFDGTVTKSITVSGHAGWSRGSGHIDRSGPLRSSIIDHVWSSWYFSGVTNKNSSVTWDSRLGEYILCRIAQSGRLLQRIWIDPLRAFGITREESTKVGTVFMADRYWGWHEVDQGHWLPSHYSFFIAKLVTVVGKITARPKVNVFVPQRDLRVVFPAGIKVFDGITGKLRIARHSGTGR